MQKVLVILGPTAVGKSEFALECAKDFNGEIISADSIQVYRGLDIGSAKLLDKQRQGIKHHLLDILDPLDSYSVKDFQYLSRECIEDISSRDKLPIIAGGTGLYIKACLYDYTFYQEQQEDDQFLDLSNDELYDRLKEVDPLSLEKIHVNNRKRLVRALNVFNKHQQGLAQIREKQKHEPMYDALIIGLTLDRKDLYQKIDNRVDKMIEDGLLDEISDLLKEGVSFSNQCMQAIGYKEFKDYFAGNKQLDECIKQVKTNTHHFVKRQYTYFKNQLPCLWYDDTNAAKEKIKEWKNEV